ncbi:hypothetical protein [Nitrosomonas sp.]|uniref:hypothetical protein n=1 Tax=Nitrosomonas sp. TaxID=42353 RepID=UPI0035B226C9
MDSATRQHLMIAFFLSFFTVGIPYWRIPYNTVNLPEALPVFGLIVVGGAAMMLRLQTTATFWQIIKVMTASVPAAVFARVVWDGFKDPSSHNLWPFEIAVVLPVGFACAVTGVLAGSLIAAMTGKPQRRKKR